MNPGESLDSTAIFPMRSARLERRAMVSSLVRNPRMSSTNFMTGTGFMKCMPATRVSRPDMAPNFVMEIEDVLLARMTAGLQMAPSCRKMSHFSLIVSGAASRIRWRSTISPSVRVVWIRLNAESPSAVEMMPS